MCVRHFGGRTHRAQVGRDQRKSQTKSVSGHWGEGRMQWPKTGVCSIAAGPTAASPHFLTPTPIPITPGCPGSWRKAGERAKMQALPEAALW